MAKKQKTEDERFRCLSVQQPFAWLICVGAKTIENRTWKTDFRGTIAIHASTKKDRVRQAEKASKSGHIKTNNFSFGAIIGLADIVSVSLYGEEHENDGHASGPYCWKMANGRLLKEPIPLPGKLNLFFLDESVSMKLESAESYAIDLRSDEEIAAIVEEFEPVPDPYRWYRYCVRETLEKEDAELLLPKCNRMVELQPEKIEPYLYRIDIAKEMENDGQVAANLDQIAKILIKKYGNGDNDEQLRNEFLAWLESEEEQAEIDSETEDVEESSDSSEDADDDGDSQCENVETRYLELLNSLAFLANEYRLLELWDASLECAARCVRLDPDNLSSSVDVGLAYLGLERFHDAIDTFQLVIAKCLETEEELDEEEDNWRPYALLQLATCYRKTNQLELAKKTIDEALNEIDDDPDYFIEAARIAMAMRDSKMASTYKQKALDLGAGEEEIIELK